MTCLKGRILDGAGMKSHASMLGTFFVYTLALCMPIFKKKSSLKRLGKSSNISIVVTEKYVTSFLARPELRLVSKSLKCFTNRVVKLM